MLIELKTGETINGNLINCDSYMNLTLSECIKVDGKGEKFVKYTEMYVRGAQIKYIRMSNEIFDQLKENQQNDQNFGRRRNNNNNNNQHGGRNNNGNNNRRYNQQGGRYNNNNSNNNNNNNNRGGRNGRYNNQSQEQLTLLGH